MEEDDADFTPNINSSKLASLFGISKATSSGNSSLIYTAPKQPKIESNPNKTPPLEEKPPGKLEVVLQKVIKAYRIENGTYVNQGILGIVIVGNHSDHLYKINLYNNSKQHVSKTTINRQFTFTVAENNYASFYDDSQQVWSVLFSLPSDIIQFAKQVAIAKYNSKAEPLADLLIQNLTPLKNRDVTHDNLNVIFNVSTLKNATLTLIKSKVQQTIDFNEESSMPWIKGLRGCNVKTQMIIIAPPVLSAPWTRDIPPDSSLFMEIEVEGVESCEDSLKSSSSEIKVTESGESPADSSAEDSNIKARGASLKEALSVQKSHKASLISRMAKMGQPTLPLKGALHCGPSDSEEESSVSSSPKVRTHRNRAALPSSSTTQILPTLQAVQVPATQIPTTTDKINSGQSVAVYQKIQNDPWPQQDCLRAGVNVAYQQLIPVSASPLTSPTADLSIYMSESRTQATELRMGISKVSDKIDLVLNKLQDFNLQERVKFSAPSNIDPSGILTNIQALLAENECLKGKVEEQKEKIEQQNDRVYNLLQLNQKYLEKNFTDHDRLTERELKLQSQVNQYQAKESQLELDNNKAVEKVNNLEEEVCKLKQSNSELQDQINRLSAEEVELKNEKTNNDKLLAECTSEIEKQQKSYSERLLSKETEISELKLVNKTLESSLNDVKDQLENRNSEINTLNFKNEELKKELRELENQLKNVEKDIRTKGNDEVADTNKLKELSSNVEKLQAENQRLLKKLEEKTPHTVISDVEEVKKVMNVVYKSLQTQFDNTKSYEGLNIRQTLASTIREVTLEYLNYTASQEQHTTKEMPNHTPRVISARNNEAQSKGKGEGEEEEKEEKIEGDSESSKEIQQSKSVCTSEGNSNNINQESKVKIDGEENKGEVRNEEHKWKNNYENIEVKINDEESKFNDSDRGKEERELPTEQEVKLTESETAISKSTTEEKKSYDDLQNWKSIKPPPPPPLFDDDDDDDDWLK